ncbi:MAG: tetratricopeptide repeat protein, partial [Leptolyngbya sp. SIO1D8]|nr:tetratricopeptide repeat protein [Leptolyngbya sp. SIO1D8]
MRNSAKWLGLIVLTTLIVPAVQIPGFSQWPGNSRQRESLLGGKDTRADKTLAKSMPTGAMVKQQTEQTDNETEPLLQVEGRLETGDATLDDKSFYDTYTFEAEAGQTVIITLESAEFDTYLFLFDPDGNKIAENDDHRGTNSQIYTTLSTPGTYTVLVNSYAARATGNYTLLLTESTLSGQDAFQQAQAEIEASLEDLQSQLEAFQQSGDSLGSLNTLFEISQLYIQLSNNYLSRGQNLFELGEFETAHGAVQQSLSFSHQALENAQALFELTNDLQDSNIRERVNASLYLAHLNIGIGYELQGGIYTGQGNFQVELQVRQLAVQSFETSLIYASEINSPEDEEFVLAQLATAYSGLSQTYGVLEQYEAATSAGKKAYEIIQSVSDDPLLALILLNLVSQYQSLSEQYQNSKEYDPALAATHESLEYGQRLLALSRESGDIDSRFEQQALSNLWISYADVGNIFEEQSQYAQALEAYQQALPYAEQLDDPFNAVNALGTIGGIYKRLGNYQESLTFYERMRDANLPELGYSPSLLLGNVYSEIGHYEEALSLYGEALEIAQGQGDLLGEAISFNNFGDVYYTQGDYAQALENINKALDIARNIRDRSQEIETIEQLLEICTFGVDFSSDIAALQSASIGLEEYGQELLRRFLDSGKQNCTYVAWTLEATTLNNLANNYTFQGRYQAAIETYTQAIDIVKSVTEDQHDEALYLANLGIVYGEQGRYDAALQYYEQSFELYSQLDGKEGTAFVVELMGNVYHDRGQYEQALVNYEQALSLNREMGLRPLEGDSLSNIGSVYQAQGNYEQAQAYYEAGLKSDQELGLRRGEARRLEKLGTLYFDQGNYTQAVEFADQARAIYHEIGLYPAEGEALSKIGSYLSTQGEYADALEIQQQALAIAQEIEDRDNEADALTALGSTYAQLGQYEQALDYHEQSLSIYREMGVRSGEAVVLGSIGLIQAKQAQYAQAVDTYQQALAIYRDIGSVAGESQSLQEIGFMQLQLGNSSAAQVSFTQALEIQQRIGARGLESQTHNGLGLIYASQDAPEQALDSLQIALTLHRELGDRPSEASVLSNIGGVFADKAQPELAIVFYKEAVNVYESIRGNIRGLDLDLQASYTDSIADTYRTLAELLLEQGRIPEAQQVLDLLKLEELREFTQTTRATWTGSELQYTTPEQEIINAHSSLIALSREIITCEDINCADLDALYAQLEALKTQYESQVAEFNQIIRANRADDDIFQDPDNLSGDAEKLLSAYAQDGQQAVLIYPFVLEDKLWIVWAAAGNVIGSVEVPVSQRELATTVQRFGERLNSPTQLAELQGISQQLYDWIIRPLE